MSERRRKHLPATCVALAAALCCGANVVSSRQAALRPKFMVIAPTDEAGTEPALKGARDRLVAALKEDDLGSLGALVSSLATPATPTNPLLSTLAHDDHMRAGVLDALLHGGAFTTERGAMLGRREFCAPYAYARYPLIKDRAPWFMESPGVILEDKVAVHKEPRADSPTLAVVNHLVVQSLGTLKGTDGAGTDWVLIGLPQGLEGYVLDDEIWRPDEYHVCLANVNGAWVVSTVQAEVFSRR